MRDGTPRGRRGNEWPTDGTTRWCRRVLRAIAWMVPTGRRQECLEEWEAELWQLRTGDAGVMPAVVLSGNGRRGGGWNRSCRIFALR
jgi:hypothetical protein